MKFIFGMHINIVVFYKFILLFWVQPGMPKVRKIRSLHIFAISQLDFLPANKREHFLQVDSISLGLPSQTCSKYPKQLGYNIRVISQGKREELT